jgi:hypothetical protein
MTGFAMPFDNVKTLHDMWESTCGRHRDFPMFGTRFVGADGTPGPYRWMTYKQSYDARACLSAGLLASGVTPNDHVGLFSINCTEWCLLESAMTRVSLVSVPLYDTLGPDAVRFICNHAELSAVCVSAACLPVLLDCLKHCPSVKLVVVYSHGGGAPAAVQRIPSDVKHACRLLSFEQLVEIGKRKPCAPFPPKVRVGPFPNPASLCRRLSASNYSLTLRKIELTLSFIYRKAFLAAALAAKADIAVVSHEFSTLARLNELASEKYEELGETVAGLGVFADSLRRKDENVSPLFDDLDAVELNLTVLEGTADTLEQEADRLELRAKEVRALIAAKKK